MLLYTILRDKFRLLTFRKPGAGIGAHPGAYFAFGLCMTWMAGIGRYWDRDDAQIWQTMGFGSLAYVCCFALLLWLLVAPLGPTNWSYRKVLLFVTLTSPPALLYAIPVEALVTPSVAAALNTGFLAAVAAWRVALLVVFVKQVAGLNGRKLTVATLLPLALIVDVLAILGLEHVVYLAMLGMSDVAASDGEVAPAILCVITDFSILATPVLVACYCLIAFKARATRIQRAVRSSNRSVSHTVVTT